MIVGALAGASCKLDVDYGNADFRCDGVPCSSQLDGGDGDDEGECDAATDGIECAGDACALGRCCVSVGGEGCVDTASCNGNGQLPIGYFECDGPEDCAGGVCCKDGNEVTCEIACPAAD